MTQLFRPTLVAAGVVIALAVAGCGAGGESDSDPESPEVVELDTTAIGYGQPGTEFWEDWRTPEGTVLLGSAFPEPDWSAPESPEVTEDISAEFLVTGDPHEVMRDLYVQVEDHGLRPVTEEVDPEVCAERSEEGIYGCSLYGLGEDGLTQFLAVLSINASPDMADSVRRLEVEVAEWDLFDAEGPVPVDVEPPEGEAPIELPEIDASKLRPGAELPFYGRDEPIGRIPEGARMLAPSYSPSLTYGFHGHFVVTDERALAEFEAMAAEAATGDRYPDGELTSGDLVAQRIRYDGSAGGCGVELDTVDLTDHWAVRFNVTCD